MSESQSSSVQKRTPAILLEVHDNKSEIPKDHKQLSINVLAHPANQDGGVIGILVDTGAEINLVQRSLFPQHLLRRFKKSAYLVTANGTTLDGCSEEIILHFQ